MLFDVWMWWLIGGVLFIFGGYSFWLARRWEMRARLSEQELSLLAEQLQHTQQENRDYLERHEQQQSLLLKLNGRLKEYETLLYAERQAAEERRQQRSDEERLLAERFENLANRLLEQTSGSFRDLNQQHLDVLLAPLKNQIEHFRQQLGEQHSEETRQRLGLQYELQRLAALNQQMSTDAAALTKALKGDSKQQGNWGERVLTRVLEESGLRAGHEYELQVAMQADNGRRYQPDVLVHLPGRRHVIIDAKVSLTAYERFFSAESEAVRAQALREHVASLRNHILELGNKAYHQLPGAVTLDYVLLFVAVEPAFLVAIDAEPELTRLAFEHNILLVSPTNLLIALRTIDNLWRQERQQQNARLIAQRAGRLYEKFRLFVEEMQQIGSALGKAQESYHTALSRLSTGRGNLIAQAEQLRTLGVEVKKPLQDELTQLASLDGDEPESDEVS